MIATLLVSALISALTLMLAFPQTPAARTLHRILVEAPTRFVFELTWTRAGKLALSGAALCLMMLMGPQMLAAMLAMGADAALLELIILGWVASASGQLASGWRFLKRARPAIAWLAQRIGIRPNRARKPRPRRKSRPQGRKGDSADPEWAFA